MAGSLPAQEPELLPGEVELRLGRDVEAPARLPTIREVARLAGDQSVRSVVVFRMFGDANNHYAPAWSPDGEVLSFLRSDLSEHTGKLLVHFISEAQPIVVYPEQLSYEHMNSWNIGGRRLLAFVSNNDRSFEENVHWLSARSPTTVESSARQIVSGGGATVFPSLATRDSRAFLLFRRYKELIEVEFRVDNPSSGEKRSLADAEEAQISWDLQTVAVIRSDEEQGGHHRLLVRDRKTSRETAYYAEPNRYLRNPRWSPDGKHLAFYARNRESPVWDLMVVALEKPGAARVLASNVRVQEDFRHVGPAWAPDSRRLWYIQSTGTQGYYPLHWVALNEERGKVEYPEHLTTATDLAVCPNGRLPCLAFVASKRLAVDVYVVILNHH